MAAAERATRLRMVDVLIPRLVDRMTPAQKQRLERVAQVVIHFPDLHPDLYSPLCDEAEDISQRTEVEFTDVLRVLAEIVPPVEMVSL